MSELVGEERPKRFTLRATMFAWFSAIAFDFFLHGGILAHWYVEPSSFLLPPRAAFVRIPFGYGAFLILAALLVWILVRLDVRQWRRGAMIGLGTGCAIWGSSALGLYSITTAPAGLLAGWLVGQSIEMGIAGGFAAAALGGERMRSLVLKVLALFLVSAVTTIVLQSAGLAPAISIG